MFTHVRATPLEALVKTSERKNRYQRITSKRNLSSLLQASSSYHEEEEVDVSEDQDMSGVTEINKEAGIQVDTMAQQIKDLQEQLRQCHLELDCKRDEVHQLKKMNEELRGRNLLLFKNICDNRRLMKHYTGVSKKIFLWIVQKIKGSVAIIVKSLSLEDHLMVILMKIKTAKSNIDIGKSLGIQDSKVSTIVNAYVPLVAKILKNLIVWPDSGTIRRHLPRCFKKKFRDCVVIIDCTEIFIQRQINLTAGA